MDRKKTAIITVVVVVVSLVIIATVFIQQLPKTQEFGTSTLFEVSEVEQKTRDIIELFTNQEYQKILDEYASAELKADAAVEDFAYATAGLGGELGAIKEIASISLTEMEKEDKVYAISESKVIYENFIVVFTFSFNENMEFSGIYMKEEADKE